MTIVLTIEFIFLAAPAIAIECLVLAYSIIDRIVGVWVVSSGTTIQVMQGATFTLADTSVIVAINITVHESIKTSVTTVFVELCHSICEVLRGLIQHYKQVDYLVEDGETLLPVRSIFPILSHIIDNLSGNDFETKLRLGAR